MEVDHGRGYVSADRNKRDDLPVGSIPVDSLFSPVTRVRIDSENTRVGQMTDYDKLILEIWTDGRIQPEDALAHAAKLLKDHLQNANIKTIGDLVVKGEPEMLKYRNFGRKSLNEIKEIISEMGLGLGMTPEALNALREPARARK